MILSNYEDEKKRNKSLITNVTKRSVWNEEEMEKRRNNYA